MSRPPAMMPRRGSWPPPQEPRRPRPGAERDAVDTWQHFRCRAGCVTALQILARAGYSGPGQAEFLRNVIGLDQTQVTDLLEFASTRQPANPTSQRSCRR